MAVVIILGALSITAGAVQKIRTDDLFVLGDANNDGKIDLKDSNLIRSHILGRYSAREAVNMDAADIVADGVINSKDAYYLKASLADQIDLSELWGDYSIRHLTVGGNDIGDYTIVIPEGVTADTSSTYAAATHMRDYILAASGKRLNIVNADAKIETPHVIQYIQYDPLIEEAAAMNLGNEGYIWEVKNGDLYIYATLRGPMYATYEILEDYLGVRYFDDKYTFFYRHSSVDIPEGTYNYHYPRLEFRFSGQQMANKDTRFDIYYPNRLNGSQLYVDGNPRVGYQVGPHRINAHSYDYYWRMGTGTMPDESYGSIDKRLDAKYQSGEQKDPLNWQPCATSEEVYQTLFGGMMDYITMINGYGHWFPLVYGDDSMSFSICDNGNYCSCRNCRSMARNEGYSGLYLNLANRAAMDVQEYLPGLKIFLILYDHTVPATIRPNEHMILMYCGHGCNNHILGTGGCGDGTTLLGSSNKADETDMKVWADIAHEAGASIWYWSYAVNYHYYIGGGCPNIPDIYYNFDYIVNECGFDGIYYEGCSCSYNFEKLKAYLATKFMWETDMSYDQFCTYMKEYLYMYYGNGYEQLFKYIMMQTEAGNAVPCFINNYDRPGDQYSYEYLREHYEEMRALLLEAYELTMYPEQKTRLETLIVSCEFLGLSSVYDEMYTNGSEASRKTYEERYSWMYNYIVNNNMQIFSDPYAYTVPAACDFSVNPMTQFYESGSRRPGVTP